MKAFHVTCLLFVSLLIVAGWPAVASAHVGFGSTDGLVSGLAHPVSGFDHLCAMIGVGIWASQRGGRAIWLLPLAFLVVMAAGGLLGAGAIAIPFVERSIVASVLIVGILIAAAVRMPLVLSILTVGTFALFHGHAHGAEMPHTASGLTYATGFLATTAFLLLSGVLLGLSARTSMHRLPVRCCGAAMTLCGLYLLAL